MTAPLLVLGMHGILVILAFFLRARPRAASLVSGIGLAGAAGFLLWGPIDEPFELFGIGVKLAPTWIVLGRQLTILGVNRAAVSFLLLVGAYLLTAAASAGTDRYFHMLALGALGFVASSLMIDPFIFAPLLLEFGVISGVMLLTTPRHPANRGALRLATLYTLAAMTILIAGWSLEVGGITGATPDLARRVAVLLGIGLAVVAAVPPFHIWLPDSAREAHPYAVAFVVILLQSAALFFLLRFLDSYTWLRETPEVHATLRWAALLTLILSSVLSLAQKRLVSLAAYVLLADLGATILAASIGASAGYQLALGLTAARVIGLAIWALGASILRAETAGSAVELRGAAQRSGLAAGVALLGVATLAGFPLTAGFPGRWALLGLLPEGDLIAPAILVGATAATSLAVIRWAYTLLKPQTAPSTERLSLPTLTRTFLYGGVVLCFAVGAFPQLLFPWVSQAAASFTTLVP